MRMGEDRQPTRSALERAQRKKGPHLSFAAPPTKAIRQGRILTLILLTSQGAFETSVLRKSVCGCFAASVWLKKGEGPGQSHSREGPMRSREVSTTDRQVAVHDPTPPEVCMREVNDAVVLLPATRRAAERMSATRRCCAEPAGRAAVCRRTTTSR
jgi:hypothetical protein